MPRTWCSGRADSSGKIVRSACYHAIALASVALLNPVTTAAQVSSGQECPERVPIPGGSNAEDRTIHRCNLDNAPMFPASLDGLPAPMYARSVRADIVVVVDPSGRVNADLTRRSSVSLDSLFHRHFLEGVHALEFEPGTREAVPVRYGFQLRVSTGMRSDSAPEQLVWQYFRGTVEDSIVGTWVPTSPDPPPSAEELAALVRSVTARLEVMRVLIPELRSTYCIIVDDERGEIMRSAAWSEMYGGSVGFGSTISEGCESDVSYVRYRIETPLRTGGGRTVVGVSGDYLERWPPGFDQSTWRAWWAHCVVPDPSFEGGTDCEMRFPFDGDRQQLASPGALFGRAQAQNGPDGPLQIVALVRQAGAFQTDTIRALVPEIPNLTDRAVYDPGERMCLGQGAWAATADWPGGGEIVVPFFLPGARPGRIYPPIDVRRGFTDEEFRVQACPLGQRGTEPFALFTLGGLGTSPSGPIRFCMEEPGCTRSYMIDPERHELASEPHIRFRFSDLREEARNSGPVTQIRLYPDRVVPGLLAFVIIRRPGGDMGIVLRPRPDGGFELSGGFSPPHSDDTEFWLYLTTFVLPADAAN